MSIGVRGTLMAVGVALALLLPAGPSGSSTGPSIVGVTQLEVGYTLGGGPLRVRATLATQEALEVQLDKEVDIQAVLRLAQLSASGARVTATIEDRKLKSLQCSVVRGGFGIH